MDDILLFLTVVMAGLAALLLIVSFISGYRLRSTKLALVGLAFVAFLIKALLLILEYITQDEKAVIIDFVILVLLYFAVIKK
jgi:hypothetical protein